jgi:hypothetical protein
MNDDLSLPGTLASGTSGAPLVSRLRTKGRLQPRYFGCYSDDCLRVKHLTEGTSQC